MSVFVLRQRVLDVDRPRCHRRSSARSCVPLECGCGPIDGIRPNSPCVVHPRGVSSGHASAPSAVGASQAEQKPPDPTGLNRATQAYAKLARHSEGTESVVFTKENTHSKMYSFPRVLFLFSLIRCCDANLPGPFQDPSKLPFLRQITVGIQ